MAKKQPLDNETVEVNSVPPLPISKAVYAVGMSMRDSWFAFMGSVLLLTPLIRYGSDKVAILKTISEIPEKIKTSAHKLFGKNGGEWGAALTVAVGISTIIGFIGHMPGLLRGPKKVAQAEKMYEDQVQRAQLLATDNERLKNALAAVEGTRGSMADRVRSTATSEQGLGA